MRTIVRLMRSRVGASSRTLANILTLELQGKSPHPQIPHTKTPVGIAPYGAARKAVHHKSEANTIEYCESVPLLVCDAERLICVRDLFLDIPGHLPATRVAPARLQHLQAFRVRPLFHNLNRHTPYSPLIHYPSRRYIEINSVCANQGGAVIVDNVCLTGFDDSELGADWET